MKKSALSFDDVTEAVIKHITERHWDTNSPRGLAVSMVLESSELLEHYQWQDEPVGNVDELAGELADIFIYAIQFADKYDIDISDAIVKKLEKSSKKYPLEKFSTTDEKARKAAWIEAKMNHKKDTIL